jgi:hypothetical protein
MRWRGCPRNWAAFLHNVRQCDLPERFPASPSLENEGVLVLRFRINRGNGVDCRDGALLVSTADEGSTINEKM